MSELVEFLRARLDERERVARRALDEARRDGGRGLGGDWYANQADSSGDSTVAVPPDVALADVEAKRRIVDWLGHTLKNEMGWDGMDEYVLECLALPFADHPDYDPSWRPAEVTA